MRQLLQFIFSQVLLFKFGAAVLYIYYRLKGKKISYRQILNQNNPKTGIKKHAYKAFYAGLLLMIVVILIISTLNGNNPKLEFWN